MATIIDGRALAKEIREEIRVSAEAFHAETGVRPGLATVLVGDDPASHQYVRMKGKAADKAGFNSRQITLPGDTPHDELLGVVEGLNADPEIHGILVQLPLPDQIDEDEIIEAIDPAKDVDGFHPVNVGRLSIGDEDVLAPCTPAGIVEMLLRYGYDPSGKHVVVVGRSNIVGKPLALLLLRKARGGNATVTVAHSRTPDLGAVTREADIVVAAVGRPDTVTRDMVKEGVVVIDVGSNRIDDPSDERGYRWVGDVDYDGVSEVAEAITPVPGGVGPMTITMLLSNTLEAARRSVERVPEEAGAR
ncbi:MAG: bifunctional methylenetetrahydrofolate dehydrogenase/methenyltetrahydrofolate cyclohydrolase FolD [Gemmatimonadetes bacterium]|nr:bifunctional methylenetetrahydrofolate dehydrogenase/methenyltetrahydrofolate cyclohydrolase FolD [Gemmatimonadota bacterium]NIQ54365.1 bifunctional methylenetetrahydrofolate dehydrogenase/methenyltetrahydrofolate cyclohydrolase FolD [Gemmatimonadota bacterium]NIU74579.1 bifunctional methylenetetrahydrofolate dehydrogenase/methenyltetrahydrofolate cyclohydrolase FolD [Gammaproteobacteria bacterium]NIX44515.1 bifunctional methylenetetrahydrofolate dehydrogenase/methenyltetrahydrofolate cyclohy